MRAAETRLVAGTQGEQAGGFAMAHHLCSTVNVSRSREVDIEDSCHHSIRGSMWEPLEKGFPAATAAVGL